MYLFYSILNVSILFFSSPVSWPVLNFLCHFCLVHHNQVQLAQLRWEATKTVFSFSSAAALHSAHPFYNRPPDMDLSLE